MGATDTVSLSCSTTSLGSAQIRVMVPFAQAGRVCSVTSEGGAASAIAAIKRELLASFARCERARRNADAPLTC